MNAPLIPNAAALAALDFVPGLQRYLVDEHKATAQDHVRRLHELSRNSTSFYKKTVLERAAVLLDEYQAGGYLATPCPQSGWVLVPATVLPKVKAAVEALIGAMDDSDAEVFSECVECSDEQWHAAMEGGRAILAVVEALEAQP